MKIILGISFLTFFILALVSLLELIHVFDFTSTGHQRCYINF